MYQSKHQVKTPIALALLLSLVLSLLPAQAFALAGGSDFERDASLRGLNEEFYSSFTKLITQQDTSRFFGMIRMTLGEPHLNVDGREITLDAAPEFHDGKIMLPIRPVAEAAHMTVNWENGMAVIKNAWGDEIRGPIGTNTITVNGTPSRMDAAYVKNGRSYFSVSAIRDALMLDVDWDAKTQTVTLTAPYQTARLTVLSEESPIPFLKNNGLTAGTALDDGSGMWVLQFSSPAKAKRAADLVNGGVGDGLIGAFAEPDIYIVTKSASSNKIFNEKQDSWGLRECGFDVFFDTYSSRFQERVTVAVVDTGVDASHPALRGRLLQGRDFVENDNLPDDEDSHGTHVAATILDCVGDAPVDILPVRVVAGDGASCGSLLGQGIRYAANRYAKVINVSLGGVQTEALSEGQKVFESAVQYALAKGAVVVVSAGNDNSDTAYYCPANLKSPGVVVVSAADAQRNRWTSSNYGESVDLMAPGIDIVAAVPGGEYASKTGTSMAAPHVSAAAALLYLSSGGTITPIGLENALYTAATNGKWADPYTGYGFLDLDRANVPEYQPPFAFDNVLMSDRSLGAAETIPDYAAFNGTVLRKEISSVTFLDSMKNKPTQAWDVSENQDGSVMAWTVAAGGGLYNLYIAADGVIGAPANCATLFAGYQNMTEIRFNGVLDTQNTTDMKAMFYDCKNLATLDVSGFDTSRVTDMGFMFSQCEKLVKLDVSSFDTANVVSMRGMFQDCTSLESLDVSGFDTSNVTDMEGMFGTCSSLAALNLSGFNTSRVNGMSHMFYECESLTALDLGRFNTAGVTNMSAMFADCSKLERLDVSGFDTSNVRLLRWMFYGCRSLVELNVSGFDTSSAENLSSMFFNCEKLTALDVGGFDTSSAKDLSYIFYGCRGLAELDVSGFDTAHAVNIAGMFINCSGLTALDINGFDTSNAANMEMLFAGCTGLKTLDVSGLHTSRAVDFRLMFYDCSALTALDVSGFDTSAAADLHAMFAGCKQIDTLDLSSFDTSGVTDMSNMFLGCEKLSKLDVSGFDTSSVINMEHMFAGCQNLAMLDVSGFRTENVTEMQGMFLLCTSLTSLDVSRFNTSKVTNMNSMFDGCIALTSLDVSNFDTSNVTDIGKMFMLCDGLKGKLDISGWDLRKVESGADDFLP